MQSVIDRMKDNIRIWKRQQMVKAVHMFCDIKAKDDFAVMKRFYEHWVDMERLRKKRLKSKYAGVMLNLVRFNDQTCFWRWKYNMKPGYLPTNPKHTIIFKRLTRLVNKVNARLIRISYCYILLKCAPVAIRDGRHSVNDGLVNHVMRLAGRFTPQPQPLARGESPSPQKGKGMAPVQETQPAEEMDAATSIEALMDKMKTNVLKRLNSMLLKSLKGVYAKWKYYGEEVENIANRVGSDLPDEQYKQLVCQGASRVLYELFTRTNQRNIEKVFASWRQKATLPKDIEDIEDLTSKYIEMKDQNEKLQTNLDKLLSQLDEMRTTRMFRVLKKLEYMTKFDTFYSIKEMMPEFDQPEAAV